MSKARLIITAVVLEGRSQSTVAREYGVSKGWVSKLVAHHRSEGDAAFEPRSRRPKTSPTAIDEATVELIVKLRHALVGAGLDAGPDTIHWHLEHHHTTTVSVSTIARTLTRAGLVTRGGRNGFEAELVRLGIVQKNSRPNHPTTCGKVERFQQTLKRWLDQQPAPTTLKELQTLLDTFRAIYNQQRPHRSLPRRATPATIYTARPKAIPTGRDDPHYRVRRDRIDTTGVVTLRAAGKLRHIGIGRTHAQTHVILLVDDLHVRVVDAATGELRRDLIIDTTRDYQPTGAPKGPTRPKKKRPEPS